MSWHQGVSKRVSETPPPRPLPPRHTHTHTHTQSSSSGGCISVSGQALGGGGGMLYYQGGTTHLRTHPCHAPLPRSSDTATPIRQQLTSSARIGYPSVKRQLQPVQVPSATTRLSTRTPDHMRRVMAAHPGCPRASRHTRRAARRAVSLGL
eukprot:scaffold12884_cov111-Isochrysis_galbana.AAC.5